MSTKRNNNNKLKEFAIGSKIKYNGKTYKVIRNNSCENCSIVNICINSDRSSGKTFDDVLSRDKRISIFGECSSILRSDSVSVIFTEIPMTKSHNINHNIIKPLVEYDGTIKDLQIKVPVNYEIDIDNSDLSKGIIRFKSKWLTIEQLYKLVKERNHNTFYGSIKDFDNNKLVAIAKLMDIASYFNDDWKYNATNENVGYMIAYDTSVPEPHYSVRKNDSTVDVYYGNPMFKNKDDAEYVINNPNFRTLLDKIFKV